MMPKHLDGAIDWTLGKIKPFAPLIACIATTAAACSAWRAHEAASVASPPLSQLNSGSPPMPTVQPEWYRGAVVSYASPPPYPSQRTEVDPSTGEPSMPIAFAPSSIRYLSADALFVAFELSPTIATGEPAPSKFWNHAGGGFESGPLVPAKHIRPLARMASAGSVNSAFQGFGVPFNVAGTTGAHALLYKLNPAGVYVEWGCVDGPSLAYQSGAS